MKYLPVFFVVLSFYLQGCSGCSSSGRRLNRGIDLEPSSVQSDSRRGKNVIKMREKGGVFEIPVLINGSNMYFIFDTGASDITISEAEALFLIKQGTLEDEDILGTQEYTIADGSISEGTIINLRSVKLGNRELFNVKASIIHNMEAPILLGQSALAQFGKVTIDYNRNEITLE